jgi:ribosome-associated protein
LAKLVRKKIAEPEAEFLPRTRAIAALASDKKATNIRAYDLRGLTLIADSFVICSASSDPHVKAVYTSIVEGMKAEGVRPIHNEGSYKDGWIILDYGDVIAHIFKEETRDFYDLDGLWGDAPEIKLHLR